ncbi:MAG: PEP-CTERM sorting domain-containing protein [Rubrivivax sp.]|nr:PEP-CTERM sorting domain-containing protein [Pyrinomonadaceae bacterium]
MGRRILSVTCAIAFCLLAARSVNADTIDFQSAVGSGGGQSGGAQAPQGGGSTTTTQEVQTVDFGDVTGTVCDCGEIAPAEGAAPGAASKGGFPKIPLFALAVAPIICVSGICTNDPPRRPPNNPPSDVPEPLTLATLAAGLAALSGLRARRRT